VCLSGPHVALTDDMLFQFTFTGGAVDLAAPLVKVNFFAGNGSKKVGDLLGQHVVATVPEPGSFAMMGLGMVMLGALGKKRRKQSART